MRCQRLRDIVDMELAVGVVGVDPDKKDSLMQEGEIPLAGIRKPEMAEIVVIVVMVSPDGRHRHGLLRGKQMVLRCPYGRVPDGVHLVAHADDERGKGIEYLLQLVPDVCGILIYDLRVPRDKEPLVVRGGKTL